MLLIGNEEQVRSALKGKTGFSEDVEAELIRRVAITEEEQEAYEPLSTTSKVVMGLCGVVGIILAVISFI